jgi:hypothetical protein
LSYVYLALKVSSLPKQQIILSKSHSQQATMSGFVEKLFDSFSGQGHSNQQQQQENNSYGQQQQNYGQQQQNYGQQQSYGQQQNYGQQQQPQVPYPWVARWDDRENRYIYINEQTGERSFSPPGQGQNQGYGGEQRGNQGYQQNQYSNQGYGNQQGQYSGEEKKGHGNAAAWGVGGAALGLGAGALLMHEGEDMSMTFLS